MPTSSTSKANRPRTLPSGAPRQSSEGCRRPVALPQLLAATAELETDAVVDTKDERRSHLIRRFSERRKRLSWKATLPPWKPLRALPWTRPNDSASSTLYLLEKAAYEIAYEARNRPKWLPIPLSGFAAIVDRYRRPQHDPWNPRNMAGLDRDALQALADGASTVIPLPFSAPFLEWPRHRAGES